VAHISTGGIFYVHPSDHSSCVITWCLFFINLYRGRAWNEYSPPGEKVPSPYAGFSSIDDFAESGANYIMLNNDIYLAT